MSDKLKSVKYNGCYFDRREEEAVRLCTMEGWFSCQVSSGRSKQRVLVPASSGTTYNDVRGRNGYLDACIVRYQVWRGDVIACMIYLWLVIASRRTALGWGDEQ